MDADARRAAERHMDRRDKREDGAAGVRRRNRAPQFLQEMSEDEDENANLLGRRRRRRMYDEVQGEDDPYDEVCFACDAVVDLSDTAVIRNCRSSN